MSAVPVLNATGLGNVEILIRQATVDPPSLGTGAVGLVASASVEGVEIGDAILAIPPYDTVNVVYQATAVSNDVLDVNFLNSGTGTTDLASGTWTFLIFKTGKLV